MSGVQWKTAEIGSLVMPVKAWSPAKEAPDEQLVYVDLSSINREAKEIVAPQDVAGAEAPSRAKQLLRAGDVLVSTVRPNLNAVSVVPDDLDGATGSTGFCVLRTDPQRLDNTYLFHWVRTPAFVASMVRRATGASYPAVSDRVVKQANIPLPPLPEQRRIAAILDKTDAVRRKRQQTLDLADQFLRSAFLDLFGDPVTNPKGWPVKKLGDVGTLDRGRSQHRPRNDAILLGGPYPLIQTGDVANSRGVIQSYTQTYSEVGLKQSRLWKAGTLCITIAANIANTAVLAFDACFPDSVVGFAPGSPVTTEFVQGWFSFLQPMLETRAPQVAQKNINLRILRALDIPIPPIELQNHYSKALRKVRRQRELLSGHKIKLDQLASSLVQRAFRGALFQS